MVGLLLSLLAYQGQSVLTRIEKLERNTIEIMFTLGIPPVACITPESGVQSGVSEEPESIN